MKRPTGITILALIYILRGLAALAVASLGAVILGAAVGSSILGMAVGSVFGLLALVQFAIAAALWMGKSWGRTLIMIFAVISLLVGIAAIATTANIGLGLGILIDLVILYYMTRPHVKSYFRG